jgi:hypothetical protein
VTPVAPVAPAGPVAPVFDAIPAGPLGPVGPTKLFSCRQYNEFAKLIRKSSLEFMPLSLLYLFSLRVI